MTVMVSIVNNSVTRDTRVRKEAVSLSEDLNCDYTILGIVNKDDSRPENFIAPNVKVLRIPILSMRTKFKEFVLNFLRTTFGKLFVLVTFYFSFLFWSNWPVTFYLTIIGLQTVLIIIALRIYQLKEFFFFVPKNIFIDVKSTLLTYIQSRQYASEFIPVLKELNPDIIHAHDAPMLVVASIYKKEFPKVKIVFDAHEIYEHMSDRGAIYQKSFRYYINKLGKNVDAFITINESIKKYHLKNHPNLPEAFVVKNATSSSLLQHSVTKSNLLKTKIGVPSETKILLYQGGYSVARGLDRIIKAAKLINPEWVIVFMGSGSNEEDLIKEAKKTNLLGKRIFFIPPANLEVLTSWTSDADVGIIPYLNTCLNHYFCTPNKLWEYPVARIPIIVPNYPELAFAVDTYDIGWKMDDMEPESIAKMINTINEADIKSKIKNIDNYFIQEGWEVYRKNLALAYRKILNEDFA